MSGWLRKWSGGKKPAPQAKLGEDLGMYYNKELKRWVEPGKEDDARMEAEAAAAPPKGPVSGPAGYSIDKSSIKSRYVETPAFSSSGGVSAPPSSGSLIPKRPASPPKANIWVPPVPAKPEPESGHEGVGAVVGIDAKAEGVAGVGAESEGSTCGAMVAEESETDDTGTSTEADTSSSEPPLAGEGDDGAAGARVDASPADSMGWEGLADEAGARVGGPSLEGVLGKAMVDPETGGELAGGGGGLACVGGEDLLGGGTFAVVDRMMLEENGVGMDTEGEEVAQENAVDEFAWVYAQWTEETWQEFYAWLDGQYGREAWTAWSAENWNEFWRWYASTNYAGETGQDSQEEGSGAVATAAEEADAGDGIEGTHAAEDPRGLLVQAFGQVSEQTGGTPGEISDGGQPHPEAESLENTPGAELPLDGSGASGADKGGAALGLAFPAIGVSLEDGSVLGSSDNWTAGADVATANSAVATSAAPHVSTSAELGAESDRQRPKAGKLTGPMPWDDELEMDGDSVSPEAVRSQITSLAVVCEEQRTPVAAPPMLAAIGVGENPEGGETTHHNSYMGGSLDVGSSAGGTNGQLNVGSDVPMEDLGTEETAGVDSLWKPDAHDGHLRANQIDDPTQEKSGTFLKAVQAEEPVIGVGAAPGHHRGLIGLAVGDDRTSSGQQTAISCSDGDETVGSEDRCVQRSTQQAGLLIGSGTPQSLGHTKNGLVSGADGLDVGAVLLEIQELLGHVPCDESNIAARKEKTQVQLAQIIGALKLGEDRSRNVGALVGSATLTTVAKAPAAQQPLEQKTQAPLDAALQSPSNGHSALIEDVAGSQVAIELQGQAAPITKSGPLPAVSSAVVEELMRTLKETQEKLDTATLALGMQSRKVMALRQHCAAHGVNGDAIVHEIESMYFAEEQDSEMDDPWADDFDTDIPGKVAVSHQGSDDDLTLPAAPHEIFGVQAYSDSCRWAFQ
eukprot:evm.model.scf_3806.1 EVM.evm.TU.scf_3806.1   scf_3806:1819-5040(+)